MGDSIVSIDFIDDNTGWALIDKSFSWALQKTTDGGLTWTQIADGPERTGTAKAGLQFFSETNGWMWFGGTFTSPLLRTTDGGVTWEVAETPLVNGANPEVALAHFLDDQNGWIAGRGRDSENNTFMLAKTSNAGATWDFVESPVLSSLREMKFKDANNGIVLALGAILVTRDGGASWESPPLNPYESFDSLYYDSTSGRAWAGGEDGFMLMSEDNGVTWMEVGPQRYGTVRTFLRTASGRFFVGGSEFAEGFLHEGTEENIAWKRHSLPRRGSSAAAVPHRVEVLTERPDGTLFFGSTGTLFHLPPDQEPVIRATGERHPYNILPGAIAGEPWEFQLRVIDGVGPFTWSLSGAPDWMSINPATGLLSGTSPAAEADEDPFGVTVSDSRGRTDTMTGLQIRTVGEGFTFFSTPLGPAVHRRTHRVALEVGGGNRPYTWRVVDGALPRGMTVEGEGILAGTPQELGTYSFTLEVTDASGIPQRATASFSMQVTPLAVPGWEIQHAYNRLTSIHFFDENEGIAGGFSGVLYRTMDGGRTWTMQSIFDIVRGASVVDMQWRGDTGLLTARYGVYRSANRGRTWVRVVEPRTEPVGTILPFVHFASDSLVFLRNDRITRSTDGGQTWQAVDAPVFEEGFVAGLAMANDNRGWATASGGALLRTNDGGATWTSVNVPAIHDNIPGDGLEGVAAVGDKVWIGTRIQVTGQGIKFFRSADDGQSWTQQHLLPNSGRIQNIQFLPDGQHGWITGQQMPGIFRTTDGGQTWARSATWNNDAWS